MACFPFFLPYFNFRKLKQPGTWNLAVSSDILIGQVKNLTQ